MSLTFQDFGLRGAVLAALEEAGYRSPTPIQAQAIPTLLEGHDLIGVAQTGTGKTLAYLLPIFERLDLDAEGPQAVVVCPTRELAIQVAGEAERFGRHLGVRAVLTYGGTGMGDQKRALQEGCHVLVGTPGRLLDLVGQAWISLRRVRVLVLDEADRMLDMGFIHDVDAILRKTPMSRQTLLFSATFPEEIRKLSERYLLHPETVRVDPDVRVKDTVDHAVYPVAAEQKVDLILEILDRARPSKCLIFCATREGTAELARRVRTRGHEVVSLSSLLSQANRERALTAFRDGGFDVMVATDVAARGLDITDIDLVVNFDVPMHAEDYVHRIGRTGRAERSGKAVTIAVARDLRRIAHIEELLGSPVERVFLEGFAYKPVPAALRRGATASAPSRKRTGGSSSGDGEARRRPSNKRRRGRRAAGSRREGS